MPVWLAKALSFIVPEIIKAIIESIKKKVEERKAKKQDEGVK